MSMDLLHFEIGDENLVVVETALADGQQPFCQSLTVLQKEKILILNTAKQSDDILHLLLELVLTHLQFQLIVGVDRQQLLDGDGQLRVDESLLYSTLVVSCKIANR